jgi:hypothetical protein
MCLFLTKVVHLFSPSDNNIITGMKKKRKKKDDGGDDDDEAQQDGGGAERKVRRLDVSRRKQERKNLNSSVIKCSLSGRFCQDARHWTPEARAVMLRILDKQVESLSQMMVRGSMVANEVLLTCLRENLPLPPLSSINFFRHCIVGKSDYPIVTRVLEEQFQNHPAISRSKGDWAAINILTNRYAVNAKNSFCVPFLDRQKAFLTKWLEHRELDKSYRFDMICEINGWPRTTPRVFPSEVHELIKRHRQLLEEPQDLHPKRLHPHLVVPYYYELQCFYDNIGYARISLLPLCTPKRHFMTIDSTVLLKMLLNVLEEMGENAPDWIKDIAFYDNVYGDAIHACRDEMWQKTFGLKKLKTSSKRRFDHQVDTDGISACFHFSYPKPPEPTDPSATNDRTHFLDAKRIISIDPGRTNLVTAYDSYFDKFYTFTRKDYYGVFRGSMEKLKTWEKHMQPINEELSQFSLRSGNADRCEGYRNVYFKWYYSIWRARLAFNRARESLNIFFKKRKVLDQFFAKIRGPNTVPAPKVAYGAASIRPHAHGEMSVPVKYILKVCQKMHHTTMVNEYLTTKTHEACGSRMHPVKNEGEPANYSVRGLYWCQTCRKFVNRDRNAALNILLAARCIEGRPNHLAFGQPAVYMQTLALLPPKLQRRTGLVSS